MDSFTIFVIAMTVLLLWTAAVAAIVWFAAAWYNEERWKGTMQRQIEKVELRFGDMRRLAECLLTDGLKTNVYELGVVSPVNHVLLKNDGTVHVRDDVHNSEFASTNLRFLFNDHLMRIDDPTTIHTLRRDLHIVPPPPPVLSTRRPLPTPVMVTERVEELKS